MNQKDFIEKEWRGMPEFVQEKKEPFSKIVVRFECQEDLDEFAELIGQNLTPKTKSIWHPFRPHRRPEQKYYVYSPKIPRLRSLKKSSKKRTNN